MSNFVNYACFSLFGAKHFLVTLRNGFCDCAAFYPFSWPYFLVSVSELRVILFEWHRAVLACD